MTTSEFRVYLKSIGKSNAIVTLLTWLHDKPEMLQYATQEIRIGYDLHVAMYKAHQEIIKIQERQKGNS